MINLDNQLAFHLQLGSYQVPTNGLALNELMLQSDIRFNLPAMQMDFADPASIIGSEVSLTDALPITMNLGRSSTEQQVYKFRLFNPPSKLKSAVYHHKISGYLDAPIWFYGSSSTGVQGTSAEVIKKIAAKDGLTVDADPTSDAMVWFPNNRRYGQFARDVAKHGYAGPKSLMALGVRLDNTVKYKDINSLQFVTGRDASFTYKPDGKANQFLIVDNERHQLSGTANAFRGYRETLIEQNLLTGTVDHKEVQVMPRASQTSVNSDVQAKLQQARVEVTPLVTDNVHQNYYLAQYQNLRAGLLNSVGVTVLTPQQTSVDLLDIVNVQMMPMQSDLTQGRETYDGHYIVVGKIIFIRGVHYVEKIRLVRAGYN